MTQINLNDMFDIAMTKQDINMLAYILMLKDFKIDSKIEQNIRNFIIYFILKDSTIINVEGSEKIISDIIWSLINIHKCDRETTILLFSLENLFSTQSFASVINEMETYLEHYVAPKLKPYFHHDPMDNYVRTFYTGEESVFVLLIESIYISDDTRIRLFEKYVKNIDQEPEIFEILITLLVRTKYISNLTGIPSKDCIMKMYELVLKNSSNTKSFQTMNNYMRPLGVENYVKLFEMTVRFNKDLIPVKYLNDVEDEFGLKTYHRLAKVCSHKLLSYLVFYSDEYLQLKQNDTSQIAMFFKLTRNIPFELQIHLCCSFYRISYSYSASLFCEVARL